ncbi:TPA: integrase [Stenotrophomonas maltophilia]|uniref:site-specific integrase n=1 Tax=Stenotrophomonas maltophilia TaxID=40324 RepID=UPI001FA73E7F|nr:site-specific integrase [Stenotrophomonas maltophilia]
MRRSSGLYVRFFVPTDLQSRLGSRYLVKPLRLPLGDHARLAAARMGVALSQAFAALRRLGGSMDRKELDELLRKAAAGELFELTLEGVQLPNGTKVSKAQIDTPQDAALFAGLAGLDWSAPSGMEQAVALKGRRLEQLRQSSVSNQPSAPSGPMLSQAIADHLADLARAGRDPKTIIESRQTLRILLGLVGDVPASALSVDHVRELLDGVRHWPKHASQRAEYRELSVKKIIALSKANGEPPPMPWTLNKHWDRLSVFVRHLHAAGVLDRDLMAALARPTAHKTEAETGRPFSHAELQSVFGTGFAKWSAKWPHRYWGVVLGLYSGARVTEVAQLRVSDVQAVEGVWGFVVTPVAEGNKVKNTNSRRFVPLAQPVLDAGFLGYVDEVRAVGLERLFPNLPNGTGLGFGRQLSRQFSAYIKAQGIADAGMGFHAFRHYLITHLDRALMAKGMKPEAREPAIGRLSGHYKPPSTTLRRVYVDRDGLPVPAFCEPETLQERVETLALFAPPVTLPAYTPGQFGEQLKRAAVLAKREARAKKSKSKAPA